MPGEQGWCHANVRPNGWNESPTEGHVGTRDVGSDSLSRGGTLRDFVLALRSACRRAAFSCTDPSHSRRILVRGSAAAALEWCAPSVDRGRFRALSSAAAPGTEPERALGEVVQMTGPKFRSRARLLRLVALLGGVALGTADVRAASFTVTRTDDTERGTCSSGDCSLREAIAAANALAPETSTITLPAGTYVLTIAQRLSMTADITVTGAGSATTVVDGNQVVGVFATVGTDEIDGVTVRNGLDGSGVGGGGIHNGGTLTATDLVLQGNSTNGQGGGLFNEGTAYLFESVLQNNTAAMGGGFSNTSFI